MGVLVKMYLILYNALCIAGWLQCAKLVLSAKTKEVESGAFWREELEPVLTYTQTAAVLEIFHALFKLVRSPVVPTMLQVGSRIVVLWGFTKFYPAAFSDPTSLCLMVLSWSAVEIIRYNFYFLQLLLGKGNIPYALFYARYSAFMLLYPSGISGEILQILNARSDAGWPKETSQDRLSMILLAAYVPLGPFMIMNMWGNRKRAFKRGLKPRAPRPPKGVSWPIVASKSGKPGSRSTTATNRAIWADAIAPASKALADAVRNERNWRFGYVKHVVANVRASCTSAKVALNVAAAGLAAAHKLFQFVRDGAEVSLSTAMANPQKANAFSTMIIEGTKNRRASKLEIPYGGSDPTKPYYTYKNVDKVLRGKKEIDVQLKKWVAYGTIEQSAADAIRKCAENPDMMDLSDRYFVLLGATSAMGPLDMLLKYGANVIAVDLDREVVWQKLIAKARDGTGKMYIPVKTSKIEALGEFDSSDSEHKRDSALAKIAGCDLLSDTPEIAQWLCGLDVKKPMTVGNYTYLDGGLHVQLSIACDAIIGKLCEARKDTSIAFLCTPTDVHPITKEAHDAARANRNRQPWWQSLINVLSGNTLLRSNVEAPASHDIRIVDGLVSAQGPNYALAKRIQHWRAMIAWANGHVVASNVAPSTATKSVVHAATFAAAYGGMHNFPPMEVMYQETSNAVMGALLIHDVCSDEKRPADPQYGMLDNPIELFKHGSFHGGVWRAASTIGSTGETCFVLHYLGSYTATIVLGLVASVATALWVHGGEAALGL